MYAATMPILATMRVNQIPPLTREQALLQAGQELLSEYGDPPALREAICETVTAAGEAAFRSQVSHQRGRHWREQFASMGLAEAITPAPANERWSANEIATMAAELGIDPDSLDIPSIAKEGTAAMAYVSPVDEIYGLAAGELAAEAAVAGRR